jgi:UDP-N-acetylglucosamine transferase subunit ALG13
LTSAEETIRPRPQVFVTVGTDHHPFDRMVDWVESWLSRDPDRVDCFIQFGSSRPPSLAAGERLVPREEMDERVATADVIVCHGGPGTIIDCLRSGTKPIVLPRRHASGEHVDDHQRRFARRLEEAGYIKVAESADELAALIELALDGSPEFKAVVPDDAVAPSVERFAAVTEPLTGTGSSVRVLYIGGWGRSGSTLLDRLLGQLPGACSVGEMRDLWLRGVIENRRCGCGEPFRTCPFWSEVGNHAFGGWSQDRAEAMHALRMRFDRPWMVPLLASRTHWIGDLERYVEATGRVYRAIAETAGATTIIDSTKIPSYALVLDRIPDIDLRFLHLVRDSRGVIHSWQKSVARQDSTDRPDRMIRYGVLSASLRYLLYNATAASIHGRDTPYMLARYEDLTAAPRETLTEIARFGGLPEDMAFMDGDGVTLEPSHTVDGNPMRFQRGHVTITPDEAWRGAMAERDRRIVSAVTRPLLHRYRYR